jgi:hypothetical protein
MSCRVDWWCPNCSNAASFRGTGKFQFGLCDPCRCQWQMFGSPEIDASSAKDPDYLEAFVYGYRLVTRRLDEIRPPVKLSGFDRAIISKWAHLFVGEPRRQSAPSSRREARRQHPQY